MDSRLYRPRFRQDKGREKNKVPAAKGVSFNIDANDDDAQVKLAAYQSLDGQPIARAKAYVDGDNTDAVARTEPVPFAMELQHVKRYVSLEQMRFGDKLAVMYDIDTTDFRLPALTVQPIIENAIKHGIGNHSSTPVQNQRLPGSDTTD